MKSILSFNFSIKNKRFGIGILLGLLSVILLFKQDITGPSKYLVLLFGAMFALLGSIRIVSPKPIIQNCLWGFWSFLYASVMFLWTFATLDLFDVRILPVKFILLNLAFIFSFINLLCFITGKWRLSVNCTAVILFVVGIINSYVWQFRDRELLFPDIPAAATALGVVKEYTPTISFYMILGFLIWILVWFSQFTLSSPVCKKYFARRFVHLITSAILLLIVITGASEAPLQVRGTAGCRKNGFYVNFLLSIRDSSVRIPEGYSQKAVRSLEEEYQSDSKPGTDLPNIIVIMNESFADFRVFGDNLNTNQPVMPFYDSLVEDTIRGYAYTSVYGGQTANSEFEFLTGQSMGLLPVGSTPYQLYVHNNTYSLAWLLNSMGYNTFATHPYQENYWGRLHVYPKIGFNSSTFIQDYPASNILRNWISDQEMYEYIMQKIDDAAKEQPQFIFGVTMQNHGGYNYEGPNYTQSIFLNGYSQEYPRAEQYLSLLNESDKALAYLVSQLEQSDQKTILVVFGDHFPIVEEELYEEIHGSPMDAEESELLKYKTPFLIWANYDIPEHNIPCTSLNFISRYVLEAAQIELPEYYRFLAQLESAIPAMNAEGFYSLSRNAFISYDEAEGSEAEWINRYKVLQYNALFDKKHRSNLFYSQYLPAAE